MATRKPNGERGPSIWEELPIPDRTRQTIRETIWKNLADYATLCERTPENRGKGLLDRPGKKLGHEIGGVRRNVRTGTDLPETA